MAKASVGYSAGIITPDLGIPLSGYSTDNRESTGVHDDLHTRAICIEKDGEIFLIVCNEMIGLDYTFSDRVKASASKYGIKPENAFVGVIHTHSGPKGLIQSEPGEKVDPTRNRGIYNADMCEKMFKIMDDCVKEAVANMAPCSIRYGFAEADGIGLNRTNKELPHDKTLLAVEFVRDDGKKVLLYNVSCHPTVLNVNNTLYSADWPYGVTKEAEGSAYDMVMFINGSAGDVSTRFTRKAPTFEEAERIGGLAYSYILKALENSESEEIEILKSFSFTHKMTLKDFGTVEEAQNKLEMYQKELQAAKDRGETFLRPFESKVEGASSNLVRTKMSTGKEEEEIRVQLLRLNDFVFIFMPSEVFSALSMPVRKELGLKTVICAYFNGSHGYITDTGAYDSETYEAMSSQFKRGEGEKLMEHIRRMVIEARS